MKRKMIGGVLFAVACSMALLAGLLTGCGSTNGNNSGEHEPISIVTGFRDVGALEDAVHEKYPEINFDITPYSGANYTAYTKAAFNADDMTDIVFSSVYNPLLDEDFADKFVDLSSYDFTDSYLDARLQDVTVDGSIYALPTCYTCIGITYNKTLLEKHGWKLPTNFKELEQLAAKAKKAGVNLALDQTQLPGYGFQYWANILDTSFLNTPEGREWQKGYLEGTTNIASSPQMQEAMKTLEKWRDLGMLNNVGDPKDDNATHAEMAKGNTLFMLGSSNTFTKDETSDEFGLMPYLSENGDQNAFVLNVSRYVSLNKHLQDQGNEQKLEDAVHVMEVLSTVEGMNALNSSFTNSALLPLKDYEPSEDNYYAAIVDELNAGMTAPFIYSGWDNAIVAIGNAGIDYIHGKTTLKQFEEAIDSSQKLLQDNSDQSYTTVTEKFDTEQSAQLVGMAFTEAAKCDAALISMNKYYDYDEANDLNVMGVSGALFPGPATDQELTSILPTGWTGNIQTVKLTGKRIKEIAEAGFDRLGDGNVYPYELVIPSGSDLADDETYKVAIAGADDSVAKEGKLKDSGVLGLQALRDFVSKYDELTTQCLLID